MLQYVFRLLLYVFEYITCIHVYMLQYVFGSILLVSTYMHTSNIDMLQYHYITCINVCRSIYITDLHTYITISLVYMYVDPLDLYYLYTCM